MYLQGINHYTARPHLLNWGASTVLQSSMNMMLTRTEIHTRNCGNGSRISTKEKEIYFFAS